VVKHLCDSCGRELSETNRQGAMVVQKQVGALRELVSVSQLDRWDLCGECVDQIALLFKTVKVVG
jgi:hypothetical protein